MEKCDEDMEQFLIKRKKEFTTEEIKKTFIDLNTVFKIMHKNKIIHRDLKLKNFLIKYTNEEKTEFIVKLADYGIGKFLNDSNSSFSGFKGSLETAAPEICLFKLKKYDNIVDIFSLGIILYQLSHNLKHPFQILDESIYLKYHEYYEKDNYQIIFSNNIEDNNFKDLIIKMLKLNPKNRLTWEEYFNHQFFK